MSDVLESLRSTLQQAAKERTFTSGQSESKMNTIRALKREIIELRKKGASWKAVAAILEENGLKASPDTVRLATQPKKRKASKQPVQEIPTGAPLNTFGAAGREF